MCLLPTKPYAHIIIILKNAKTLKCYVSFDPLVSDQQCDKDFISQFWNIYIEYLRFYWPFV